MISPPRRWISSVKAWAISAPYASLEARIQKRFQLNGLVEGHADAVQNLGSVRTQRPRQRQEGADANGLALESPLQGGERDVDGCVLLVLGELCQEIPRRSVQLVILAGDLIEVDEPQQRRVARKRAGMPVRKTTEVFFSGFGPDELAHMVFDLFAFLVGGQLAGFDGRFNRLRIIVVVEIDRFELSEDHELLEGIRRLSLGLQQQGKRFVHTPDRHQDRDQAEPRLWRQFGGRILLQETSVILLGFVRVLQVGEDLPQEPVGLRDLRALGQVGYEFLQRVDRWLELAGVLQVLGILDLAPGLLFLLARKRSGRGLWIGGRRGAQQAGRQDGDDAEPPASSHGWEKHSHQRLYDGMFGARGHKVK